ncbi:MAG: hypothetical protein IJO03_05185 [Clostridia bacterium]|nr:hypothetical protein [Clostridia bacterium]
MNNFGSEDFTPHPSLRDTFSSRRRLAWAAHSEVKSRCSGVQRMPLR